MLCWPTVVPASGPDEPGCFCYHGPVKILLVACSLMLMIGCAPAPTQAPPGPAFVLADGEMQNNFVISPAGTRVEINFKNHGSYPNSFVLIYEGPQAREIRGPAEIWVDGTKHLARAEGDRSIFIFKDDFSGIKGAIGLYEYTAETRLALMQAQQVRMKFPTSSGDLDIVFSAENLARLHAFLKTPAS